MQTFAQAHRAQNQTYAVFRQEKQTILLYLSISLSLYLSMSLYPSIHPSIHLSTYPSICVSIHLYFRFDSILSTPTHLPSVPLLPLKNRNRARRCCSSSNGHVASRAERQDAQTWTQAVSSYLDSGLSPHVSACVTQNSRAPKNA